MDLTFLVDFYEWIINMIQIWVGYLEGMITGLLNAIAYLNMSVSLVTNLSGFLPSIVSGCAYAVLTISIVKFMIGR